ncbi:MAG: hypothetical protein PCFJNLEI_00459 [Verrucomicrobiae bacterium]|nr:hypothetical protein [Verrucomicrobiae bacterium]
MRTNSSLSVRNSAPYIIMTPHQESQFLLQFGAPWSPWWLAVALPVVLLAGWWLYRGQFANLARRHRVTLLALRLGLLAALIFLLFRPSLLYRKILTYAGRVVVLLDNSASMTAKDTGYTDEEALLIARRLGREPATPLHNQAAIVNRIAAVVQEFGEFSRNADRRQDSFWNEAGRTKAKLAELFAQLEQPDLPTELFFTGNQDPGRRAYDEFADRAAASARQLLDRQAALDKQASAAGNIALREAANAIRSRTRLELLQEKLKQSPVAVSNQFVQTESLTGRSDLVGRLTELLQAESKFPLSGIVLFSDGRDLSGRAADVFTQEAARREVPICTAGIGSPREPVDLAVVSVVAPPFAVKDRPVRVKVFVKVALPEPTEVKLTVLKGTTPVAEKSLIPGTQPVTIEFTPAEVGMFRYTVRLDSVAGEIFSTQNNSADFALDVRDRKVWVLFMDWKPRWETRFALNILQRLDYVELNSIIGIVQADAKVPRGERKGAWPETLEAYDLIILGDLPPGTLTAAEEDALKTVVERAGKTVCHLGARAGVAQLQLTPAGRHHPLTRRLDLPVVPATNDTVLLADRTGALIEANFVGAGKTVEVRTDELWKLLNPTQLAAHTELYIGLVSWAMQATRGGPDLRAYKTSEPIQVWRTNATPARLVLTNLPADLVASVVVVEDDPELNFLARDNNFLETLATATGGGATDFSEYETSLRHIKPKQRVETYERRWRLWDSGVVLAVVALILTVEWVWRKWVGLV